MPATICPVCGLELHIGDWPMCGSPGGHQPLRERQARRFEPIVVWQADQDPDRYSYPGQADEPCPQGYHRVEITDLPQADKFVARVNSIERRKMEQARDLRQALDDAGVKDRRSEEDARGWVMRADGSKFYIRGNARAEALQRAARQWADRRRDQKRSGQRHLDPHFHIQVFSFDGGHRNSYSGPETGWRERKS